MPGALLQYDSSLLWADNGTAQRSLPSCWPTSLQVYEFHHAAPPSPPRRDAAREALLAERLASHGRALLHPHLTGTASGGCLVLT